MGVSRKSKLFMVSVSAIGICLLFAILIPALGKVPDCGKSKAAADLRSVAISMVVRYTSPNRIYEPEALKSMEDFLYALAEVDLSDSWILFNSLDRRYFEKQAPPIFAYFNDSNELVFDSNIMDYPIGFSVAVYPDLNRPAATTPIIWTRDLDRFAEFDQAVGGYVAYLDGHVESFGRTKMGSADRLAVIFGPESEYSKALRVLSHEPQSWKALDIDPLPIREFRERDKTDWSRLWKLLAMIASAVIVVVGMVWVIRRMCCGQV